MSFVVVGPGLVGSYLGAAGGARWTVPGPSGRPAAHRVRVAGGTVVWHPATIALGEVAAPHLVATRIGDTPWSRLPDACLCAQNGLGQPQPAMALFLAIDRDRDGRLRTRPHRPRVVLEPPASPDWLPALAAWRRAGIRVEVVADARPARWEKLILNATVGPLCLATGLAMGAVWADPQLRRLTLAATAEGIDLAAEAGVTVAAGLLERASAFFAGIGDHRPSCVHDPGELPSILGLLEERIAGRRHRFPALDEIIARVERHHSVCSP